MSYLKSRRVEMKMSQVDLAKMIGVSQQTVARWEVSGQIPTKYLKDLAIITHSTIQDLLGVPASVQLRKGAVSPLLRYYANRELTPDESRRVPYGDVEVRFSSSAGGGSKRFPITWGTKAEIRRDLGDAGQGTEKGSAWIQFEALNNKWVVINTHLIDGMSFVDDNVDAMTDYDHVEFYKAVSELRDQPMPSDEDLEQDDSQYSKTFRDGVAEYMKGKTEEELNRELDDVYCEFASGQTWSHHLSKDAAESLHYAFTENPESLTAQTVLQLEFPDSGMIECLRLGSIRYLEAPLHLVDECLAEYD